MQNRSLGNEWQKIIWKILRNPAIEVTAAIVAVLFVTWVVIQTEAGQKQQAFPVAPFAQK